MGGCLNVTLMLLFDLCYPSLHEDLGEHWASGLHYNNQAYSIKVGTIITSTIQMSVA